MTALADTFVDDAGDAPPADPVPPSRRIIGLPRRVRRWLVVTAAAVLVVGLGCQTWLLVNHHRTDIAARDALSVAERYAVTLTTADPTTIDAQVDALIDGSTGDFRDRYAKHSAELRAMLLANKVTTTGSIVDSAVKSADAHHATVVLLVKQSFTTPAMADQADDLSTEVTGMTMVLDNVGGRWLVSEVRAAQQEA